MSEAYYFVDQSHHLKERIERTLLRHPELAQAAIKVVVHDQQLILEGVVHSYYHKQVAQESLKKLLPDYRIHNQMTVAVGQ